MTIPALIDKQDNSEVVRDKIAQILANEVSSQMAKASTADKDPADWKLRVFTERSNPWEQFLDPNAERFDSSPLVNVWFDGDSFDKSASNTIDRQKAVAVYNIDCYGYGRSKDEAGGGHIPGDRAAAFAVQRALRLVRNILMASEYTYLGLQGTVWGRWTKTINTFQVQIDARNVQQIVGARLVLEVTFNEFSPQGDESNTLDLLSVDICRAEDDSILAEADYDYTAT